MKVNELRVGNLIKWGVHYCAVKSFTRSDINPEVYIYTDKTIGAIELSNFEPISITTEILEKAGFKKELVKGSLTNHWYRLGEISYNESHKGWWLRGRIKNINYVHQLQNLIFAFSDEELNISL